MSQLFSQPRNVVISLSGQPVAELSDEACMRNRGVLWSTRLPAWTSRNSGVDQPKLSGALNGSVTLYLPWRLLSSPQGGAGMLCDMRQSFNGWRILGRLKLLF